jgi:hypothetical protein
MAGRATGICTTIHPLISNYLNKNAASSDKYHSSKRITDPGALGIQHTTSFPIPKIGN